MAGQRRITWRRAADVALPTAVLFAGTVWPRIQSELPAVLGGQCLLRGLIGLPCPGCGVTRGVVAIIHGDFALAAQSNVSVFVLVLAVLAQGVALTAARFGGISTQSRLRITLGSYRALSAALLSVWLLRLGGLLPSSP